MVREDPRVLVWFRGRVLDLTGFIKNHPGGPEVIRRFKGKEVDEVIFNPVFKMHNKEVISKLLGYEI